MSVGALRAPYPGVMREDDDEEDPKRPAPVLGPKKSEGSAERGESLKDDDRDHHRHVRVRG